MNTCPTTANSQEAKVIAYTGKGDMVDFGNANSFAGEKITGREYGMTIANAGVADKVVAICPGDFSNLAELKKKFNADCIITDGATTDEADVTVTAHDDKNPIEKFLSYVAKTPTRVVHLALDSNSKTQFSKSIEMHQGVSPFESSRDTTISLRKFVGANQQQTDRAEIDLLSNGTPLEFSMESVILVKVVAGSSLDINMTIGGRISVASHLRNRANLAYNYLALKGQA